MSPESYSWEVREAAEEFYIIDGRTYEQVAEATGVSLSQLKRWGMDSIPTWSDRRRDYRQAQISVRRGVICSRYQEILKGKFFQEKPWTAKMQAAKAKEMQPNKII